MIAITRTRRLGWAVLLGLAASAAFGQEADGSTRAQRDAANPLRMIIEAGKLKPRQKQPEPEQTATPAPDTKPAAEKAPVVRLATAPRPARQTGKLSAAAAPDLASVAVEVPAELAPVELERRASPAEPGDYDPDDYFGVPPPRKPGAASAGGQAPAGRVALAPERVADPLLRPALQMADYVEPVVPERVRQRLQSDAEVVLDFTVNPDGTVADLAVRSASDKALEAVALDAVRQWRYRPIGVAQAHSVHLLFKLHQ